MVAQLRRALFVVGSAIIVFLGLLASCSRVPLLAPTGTTIKLIPEASSVSANSQMTIVAVLIESGAASSGTGTGVTTTTGGGTPVHNGTHVTFTTTVGTIQPSDAVTTNGQTQVTLITGNQGGTAHITAYSGGAAATVDIPVGAAAVKTVTLTANPQTLGANGGTANIIANVTDANGTSLAGVPVAFTTDQGTLTPSTIQTDASGNATTVLTTTVTAKVTATAGTVTTATPLTINVRPRGLSGFTASPTSTTAGTPVAFTVTPATGANVSNVHVDFGDGSAQDLGPISAATTTTHAYGAPGIYSATATATDATGPGQPIATQVIVGSLLVTLTPSATTPTVGTSVTFTVSGIAGAAIDHFVWTFDDGTPTLSNTNSALPHSFVTRGLHTVAVTVIGVGGGTLGSANAQVVVQ